MKTAREWFEMMPEPYRSQAIENTIEQCGKEVLGLKWDQEWEAIMFSFKWRDSSQGWNYWNDFYCKSSKPKPKTVRFEEGVRELALLMAKECKMSKHKAARRLMDELRKI